MHALWEYDFVKPVGTRILGLLRSDRCGFVAFVGFFFGVGLLWLVAVGVGVGVGVGLSL